MPPARNNGEFPRPKTRADADSSLCFLVCGAPRRCLTQVDVRVLFQIMDADIDTSRMKRSIYEMPDDIRKAIESRGLMAAYRARPAYQQNDYLGWITRAKQAPTREKRLAQMLDELERGGIYMHMKWRS
jgi:hypothetical protein